jgi:flagellar biosynthesis/type III secretory pathway protein FliH
MSAVIKARAANGSVRPFTFPPVAIEQARPGGLAAAAAVEAQAEQDAERDRLASEVSELGSALAAAKTAAVAAEKKAREEGRLEALATAQAADAERLALLDGALGEMVKGWEQRLTDLDGLAAAIADTALSKLFDSWPDASEFLARTVARQIRILRKETVIAIRLSGRDFPDEQALAAFASRAGTGSIQVLADPDLGAGECRADLQLGHVDLGAGAQRAELSALLESLAADGAGR